MQYNAQVERTRKARKLKASKEAQAIDKLAPVPMPFYRVAQLVRRGARSGQTAWHAYVAGIEAKEAEEAKEALEKERAKVKHQKTLWKQANAYVECFKLEERGEVFTVSSAHAPSI